MKSKQSTAGGFAALSVASIINKILAFISVPAQVHILHSYGYGLNVSGYNIYYFLLPVINTGIPIALSKLIAEQLAQNNEEEARRILQVTGKLLIGIGVAFSLIMALGAKFLADHFTSDSKTYLTILCLSPSMLIIAISSLYKSYFQGMGNMIPSAISQIIQQLLSTIATIALAVIFVKYGPEKGSAGAAFGSLIGALAAGIFIVAVFKLYMKRRKKSIHHDETKPRLSPKKILRLVLMLAMPIIITTATLRSIDLIDASFIKKLSQLGLSKHQITTQYGIYKSRYIKVVELPMTIIGALGTAILPAIAGAWSTKDFDTLRYKMNQAFRVVTLITVPIVICLFVLPLPVIRFMYFNSDYNSGRDLMMIGSTYVLFVGVFTVQNPILQAIGKPYIVTINAVVGVIIKAILSYFLIPINGIGIRGVVIGTVACYAIICILNHLSIKRCTGFALKDKDIIVKQFVCSIVMAIAALAVFEIFYKFLHILLKKPLILNDISLMAAFLVSGFLYGLMLIKLKALGEEDLRRFPGGNRIVGKLRSVKLI